MKQLLQNGNAALYSHYICTAPDTSVQLSSALQVYMVLSGECQVQFRSMNQHLKINDLFFFPMNAPYGIFGADDQLLLYGIDIYPEFFRQLCPGLLTLNFDICHVPCNTYDHTYEQLCRLLSGVVFSGMSSAADGPLKQLTYINQLIVLLGSQFGTHFQEPPASDDYRRQRMAAALEYIHHNYREKISLDDISDALGLHPQYFSSFFKKNFHMGFVDYVNLYRVNQSLAELTHSRKTILEIALSCGFHSHKSYCSAFKKFYEVLPSDYRSQNQYSQKPCGQIPCEQDPCGQNQSGQNQYGHNSGSKSPGHDPEKSYPQLLTHLQYLRSYWEQPESSHRLVPSKPLILEMDLSQAHVTAVDHRLKIISVGSGFFLLQKRNHEQLVKLATECKFTHVHFRDVFSDLLKIYTDPGTGQPLYYWDTLDSIIEDIHRLGMYPFIEIGYMPRELASARSELGFSYHPNVSAPKSASQWTQLIVAFLRHYMDLYGAETMRQWMFDFWNSANIGYENGYWSGDRKSFFELYRLTFEAFRSVDPQLSLGSPNFSLPDGMDWYEAFFDDCQKNNITPAFLTLHLYSCMDNIQYNPTVFPYPPTTYNYLSLTNTQYTRNILRFLKDMLKKYKLEDLPVIATEWNITYYLLDLIRDTAFMAPYIVHTWFQTLGLSQGLAYFTLSDNNDQARPSRLPFPGNSGLMDSHSLPKPAYNAFYLLHKLDPDIIACEDGCVITRGDQGYHMLIYNLAEYDNDLKKNQLDFMSDTHRYQVFAATDTLLFHGIFKVAYGSYTIRRYLIDREHGSVFDAWQRMGSPTAFTEDVCHYLECAAEPAYYIQQQAYTDTLTIEGEIAPHGVMMIEIIKEKERN